MHRRFDVIVPRRVLQCSAGGMSATTGRIFHGRQIDHGVLIEEARRRQRKAAIDTRLHRMIFRPRQMMYTETMPQDDIACFRSAGPWRSTPADRHRPSIGSRTRPPGSAHSGHRASPKVGAAGIVPAYPKGYPGA